MGTRLGLEATADGAAFWHWGGTGTYKNFAVAYREKQLGVVIMTNGGNGLMVCEEIVSTAIGGDHPAFSFAMLR